MAQEVRNERASPEETLHQALNEIALEMCSKLDAARPPREPSNHSRNNWCSEAHHPCLKNLVHCRIDWKERQQMDLDGRWRTEEGTDKEWKVKKWLGDIGFEITQSQRYFSTDDPGLEEFQHLHLSGKIDGASPLNRELPEPFGHLKEVPAEVKTVNPNYWNTTRTIEDIKRHPKFWINKIPTQLNNYLLFFKSPGGFLIIATFGKRLRILPMLFDRELWEYDRARIEKVNAHVEAGTYPPPMPFDATICGMCDFDHICAPLKSKDNLVEISGLEEMELEHYLELEEWKTKFMELHMKLIGKMDKPGKYFGKEAIVNDIEISTKRSIRKKCVGMPKELKEPYMEDYELIQTKIKRVGE